MRIDTFIPRAHVMKMGRVLLIFAVLGGKSVGASFDCKKHGLSNIESTICAHSELSRLDSALGSVYAVAKATSVDDAKDALLKTQKTWLAARNLCSSDQCLLAAYNARIAELSSSPNVRGIDFELLPKAGPHGWEPQCAEIPLTFFGQTHIEPTELPQAFAEFIPFVPSGSKVLDLRCTDVKGDGSITYLLVTREPYGVPGTLTLLSRSRGGSLRVESRNASVIQSDTAGAAGGYDGIVIHPKGFTVENTVGASGAEGSFKFTFQYSRIARTWILESIDTETDSKDDDPPHTHQHLGTANFGHITFDAFDAIPYGIAVP